MRNPINKKSSNPINMFDSSTKIPSTKRYRQLIQRQMETEDDNEDDE